jgi:hypothetical protein
MPVAISHSQMTLCDWWNSLNLAAIFEVIAEIFVLHAVCEIIG